MKHAKRFIVLLLCALLFVPAWSVGAENAENDDGLVDVTDFGANGADDLDDTAAVAAALEAARPGDTVLFPAGMYILDQGGVDGLPLKSGLTYLGEGEAVLTTTLTEDRFLLSAKGVTDVIMENLTIEKRGIYMSGTQNFTLIDSTVRHVGGGRWPYGFAFFITDGSQQLYFYNNRFHDNGEVMIGWSVQNSEFIGNVFERNHEPIHFFGESLNNKYINNKFAYFGRMGIELQDIHTGAVIEHNEFYFEQDPEGSYAISFAAPGTEYASIRNNIIVGGSGRIWGAGIEVMGQPTVEGNIIVDWQHGMQISMGYKHNNDPDSPVAGGPTIRSNVIRNPNEYGLWRTHVTDIRDSVIEGNFIENAKMVGIYINRDNQNGLRILDNMIVRDAGYWEDDDQQIFVGLHLQTHAGPAGLYRGNVIAQRSAEAPDGFGFTGIHFANGHDYEGDLFVENAVTSAKRGLGTGIVWEEEGALDYTLFVRNHFQQLGNVLKSGQAGDLIAVDNTARGITPANHGPIASNSGYELPIVDAGEDQTIDFAAARTVRLQGSVSSKRPVGAAWSVLTAAGIDAQEAEVAFADPTDPATTAEFSKPGWYALKFTADDGRYAPWDVVVIKVEGECGDACAEDRLAPTPPRMLHSPSQTDSTIELQWGASADNVGVAGYHIYMDGVKIGSTNGETQYTVTGLNAGVGYAFKVSAYDAAGNESPASLPISAKTELPSDVSFVYLSDLEWVSATAGFGEVRRDASSSGGTLTINGVKYGKGIGTHAESEIIYHLEGQYTRFVADVGTDDAVTDMNMGTISFEVWLDGAKVFDSGIMNPAMPAKSVDVDVTGANELKLIVTEGGDNDAGDHANWADARLIK